MAIDSLDDDLLESHVLLDASGKAYSCHGYLLSAHYGED